MIDWNKIQKANIVYTFRKICLKWWGMDVWLGDLYGNRKDTDTPIQNQFCQLIQTTEQGKRGCVQNYKKHLKGIVLGKTPFVFKCHAGVYGAVAPIMVNNKHVGAIIGSGAKFSNDGIKTEKLKKFGLDKDKLRNSYNSLQNMHEYSESRVVDLFDLVAKDIATFCEMLAEKEGIIKKQAALLDMRYAGKYKGIIGESAAMKRILGVVEQIEEIESPVLIDGESGTGKELIAAAIHYNSVRKGKMFVIQNCSAFSETLLISELFGHEKGAFTGAVSNKKGLFEIADGGTLFLDEIGDMHIDAQAKLLRVLEQGTFYSVGGTAQKKVNVRVLAATNKNLKELCGKGLFRNDLFYRINTIHITVPPLKERKEDIPLLIDHFLTSYAEIHNKEKKEIYSEALRLLMTYSWPGNVRELKNVIEYLIIFCSKNKTIDSEHLQHEIVKASRPVVLPYDSDSCDKLKDMLRSYEEKLIKEALERAKWNKTVASKTLGISRASLNNKIAQVNIQTQPKPS